MGKTVKRGKGHSSLSLRADTGRSNPGVASLGKSFPPHPGPLLLRQAQDGEPVEPHGGERENKDSGHHRVRVDKYIYLGFLLNFES